MATKASKASTVPKGVIGSVQNYIDKIVSDSALGGMKALLLDNTTTKIVSMVYSQTQILEKEVYLIEKLGKDHEPLSHLKAAVFVQPTQQNIELLKKEVKDPKFKEYHIFFSNVCPQQLLGQLAKADVNEVIMQVQEVFADFMVVNEEFFHLGIENSIALSAPNKTGDTKTLMSKNVAGVLAVLLSMKRKPKVIRYTASSAVARELAFSISDTITQEETIFEFRGKQEHSMLLVLDRRDDPVTPLLTQWTYQAMVHELLGLHQNRVLLKGAPGISKDLEEVVLSVTQDDFFARQRYSNFGDLGTAVKEMMDEYQKLSKSNENIASIKDMQAFLERYPDFRSKSLNVSKHVAVMSELARLTDVCQLLDISELEQEVACSNDHGAHKQELTQRIKDPKIKGADKVRLALLYLLRYESYNELREVKTILAQEKGVTPSMMGSLELLLEYAGDSRRTPGLFSSGGLMSSFSKKLTSSLNGVQNVYTQHQPLLSSLLDQLSKGKLKDAAYPPVQMGSSSETAIPTEVIVFIVGGATFEEAVKVVEFNTRHPGMQVVLGGSCVHNSSSFLREITRAFTMV